MLIYTYAGGLFSSAYTDIFQIYLAIVAFWAAFLFFAGGLRASVLILFLAAPHPSMDLSGLTDIGNGALDQLGGNNGTRLRGYRSIRLYGKGVLS